MADMEIVKAKTDEKELKEAVSVKIPGSIPLEHKPGPSEPTTTPEEDRHTKAARNINMIWEVSQSAIALIIVTANVIAMFFAAAATAPATETMRYALFAVLGFYFGRTNHARRGGLPDVK